MEVVATAAAIQTTVRPVSATVVEREVVAEAVDMITTAAEVAVVVTVIAEEVVVVTETDAVEASAEAAAVVVSTAKPPMAPRKRTLVGPMWNTEVAAAEAAAVTDEVAVVTVIDAEEVAGTAADPVVTNADSTVI